MGVKCKVLAHITHNMRLLVFGHAQASQAGLQVPGGTVEEGEHPDAAVMREAHEETGLERLCLVALPGEGHYTVPPSDTLNHRFSCRLTCEGTPPGSMATP